MRLPTHQQKPYLYDLPVVHLKQFSADLSTGAVPLLHSSHEERSPDRSSINERLSHSGQPPTETDLDEALIQAARNSRTELTKILLKQKSYSQGTLLEALVAASSGGDEQTILVIMNCITTILENSKFTWPVSLLYRAAFLGLDHFTRKLLDLGYVPEPGGPMQKKLECRLL